MIDRCLLFLLVTLSTSVAWAAEPDEDATDATDATDAADAADAAATGYTPNETAPTVVTSGYIDIGFARAQGDGTSFAPNDTRLPADYVSDPFVTAVNSRGDVASTDSQGRFTNGFLPRSVGIAGRPSFLVNTASFDLRVQPAGSPLMVFARAQLLPRLYATGSRTDVVLDQAFGRVAPFSSKDVSVAVGKFDPVFGIEYLENQANLRLGVTPSLLSRYTTGPSVGAKLFYREQIAPLWSALSLNISVTNSAPFIAALQPSEISLTGRPVVAARLGYELNLPRFQAKLGGSAMNGSRNDQGDPDAKQHGLGADLRLLFSHVSLSGEYVRVDQDPGPGVDKLTGLGRQTFASAFHVRGFYGTLALELPWAGEVFRRTSIYVRGEQRHAWFEGTTPLTVRRVTLGVRFDLWDALAFKAEMLLNREIEGAPTVPNDVFAASAVWSF